MKGKKNMCFDGKISADEVYYEKSYFDRIPVVARSQPKTIMRMSTPLQRQRLQKKVKKVPRNLGRKKPQEVGNCQDAASHSAAIDVELKNLAAT